MIHAHAGQPVKGNFSKFVAQAGIAGIIRVPPSKALIRSSVFRSSVFRLGPGLTEVVVKRENDSNAFGSQNELNGRACLPWMRTRI